MGSEFSAEFERLCLPHMKMLKRYLFHKISDYYDAEDVLQDVLYSAYKSFDKLSNKDLFKSWIIGIVSHKCIDYYKIKAKYFGIPLDEMSAYVVDAHGLETATHVNDTLEALCDKDKQMLYLFYIMGHNGDGTITVDKEECADIIGRYNVKIGQRAFDTVAVLEICDGIMTILYVDQNGRTVLFRRYNRFNWKTDRYKMLWTEKLPDSEVIIVNNDKYVHWYDCISDYVL